MQDLECSSSRGTFAQFLSIFRLYLRNRHPVRLSSLMVKLYRRYQGVHEILFFFLFYYLKQLLTLLKVLHYFFFTYSKIKSHKKSYKFT